MSESNQKTYSVAGMTCTGCSSRLEKMLQKHDHVQSVKASHESKSATVEGDISSEEVREIVEKAGFVFEG